MDLTGVRGVWSLRQRETDPYDRLLVQSFVGESRVLRIEDDQMEEVDVPCIIEEETVYCANMNGGLVVHVSSTRIKLIDGVNLSLVFELPLGGGKATKADSTLDQLVVGLSGGIISYFELHEGHNTGRPSLAQVSQIQLEHDIACMSMRQIKLGNEGVESEGGWSDQTAAMVVDGTLPDDDAYDLHPQTKSNLLAVCMWTDNTIRLLALPTLQEIANNVISSDAGAESHTQARAVLLVSLRGVSPLLLVGLGDGTLLLYPLDFSTGVPLLPTKRKVIIGTRPLSFACFSHDNNVCVFISCDRPTVLYTKSGKVLFSMANLQEVTGSAPFHSESFPNCLAFSSESGLKIGTVDNIQKIHIQTYSIGAAPRRICHSKRAGIYTGDMDNILSLSMIIILLFYDIIYIWN